MKKEEKKPRRKEEKNEGKGENEEGQKVENTRRRGMFVKISDHMDEVRAYTAQRKKKKKEEKKDGEKCNRYRFSLLVRYARDTTLSRVDDDSLEIDHNVVVRQGVWLSREKARMVLRATADF